MKHVNEELLLIKQSVFDMWTLVEKQVAKSKNALVNYDKILAREVFSREKNVNAYDLSIGQSCENYIALYAPVAIDLRLVLSLIKIVSNLERIGDFAQSIAWFVNAHQSGILSKEMMERIKIVEMFDEVISMLAITKQALWEENSNLAGKVFATDDLVDEIYRGATIILSEYIKNDVGQVVELLHFASVMRRIERIGDRCNNIMEDIIFYIDAKETRHQSHKPKNTN